MADDVPEWAKESVPDWAKPAPNETPSHLLPHSAGEAASSVAEPITSIPSTYQRMVGESVGQMKRGVGQIASGEPWEIAKGVGNVALGGVGYVGAPIAAPLHTIVGKPIEDVTGSPLAGQLAEAGASFALPMPKLPRGAAALPEEGPLGVTLSAGEKAGDMGMRQAEQAAIRGGDPHAVAWAAQRGRQMQSAAERIAQGFDPFGSTIAETPKEAGQLVSRGVQRAAEIRKAAVDAAYQEARGLPGELHADVFREMGNGIKADLSAATEPVVVDDKLTPFASRMVQDIDNRVANLNIQNRASPYGRPDPSTIVGVNLDGVDQMRKRLSAFRRDAYASGNGADGRAASAVLRAFDDRIDQAVNGGMFTGDRQAINAWNDARAAHSDYASTFKGRDPVGKVVQKVIGDNVSDPMTPGKVMDHLIGSSTAGLNNQTKIGVANRFKSILGETSPEWIGVKQGMAQHLMQAAEGEATLGTGQTANRLAKFLNSDMAKAIYTPQEQAVLRSYADLMRRVTMPQGSYFPSAPGINPVLKAVMHQVAGAVGAGIGHFLVPGLGGEMGGYAAGVASAKVVDRAKANTIAKQLPLVGPQLQAWAKAQSRAQAIGNTAAQRAALAATVNLQKVLDPLGIDLKAITQQGPAAAGAQGEQPQGHKEGGRINAQQQRFADGGAPEYDPLADPSTANAPGPERIWGPSWTQQALEQSQRDQDIIARGGDLHDLVQNSEAAQDLASGFGGGALGITKGAGAAMAAERLAMGERAPPLYSAVERAVADAKTPQAPAQQWLGTLKNAPGVKPEELETLGVEDFLKGQKGPVTKQALAEHIAENKVDVQEKMSGDHPDAQRMMDLDARARHLEANGETDEAAQIRQQIRAMPPNPGFRPKFGQYTLPGGENYRELLLTLPQNEKLAQQLRGQIEPAPNRPWELEDEATRRYFRQRAEQDQPQFTSSHWDEPNVLAHVRFDDRNIGGDKTLHMAEVQSDWHQKGRREGYAAGEKEQAYNSYVDDLRGRLRNELYQGGLEQGWDTARASEFADRFANSKEPRQLAKAMNEEGKLDEMHRARIEERNAVPDAPFKTTWPELALKRMIRYAAENGYDRISWDTGVTNAERYDLSKHIDKVNLVPDPSGKLRIDAFKDNNKVIEHYANNEKEVADVVGKEVAEKLLNNRNQHGAATVSGIDLKVGGEGMKAFYDRMLPNVANKLVKKYGARVEDLPIRTAQSIYPVTDGKTWRLYDSITEDYWIDPDNGHVPEFTSRDVAASAIRGKAAGPPVHSIKITPELRDQALHRGFPMFSTGIPIPPHSTDKREAQGFAKGGAVNGKATKAAAEYKTKGHPPRICGNCQMFRPPSFCTAVKGQISPQAVCKFFEAKKGRASGGRIDASHTVRTGANSSADGTVYVDPRIPAKFRKFLAVHETTEQKHMAGGYARAHKIATAAERKAVEASGMDWRHYTAEMDGYLDHIEHEKDTNPPKGKLHVSASVALGHHRSGNKS